QEGLWPVLVAGPGERSLLLVTPIILCEPASLDEGIGLTPVIATAVARVAELVLEQARVW
ncbi:MAG: hypothetical protein ACK42I_07555, partial [Thermomicrobium sp.]